MKNFNLLSVFVSLFFILGCNFGSNNSEEEQIVVGEIYEKETAYEPDVPVVVVKTQDFEFVDVPDTLSEGYTSFRVDNSGVFPHNAGVVKLLDGKKYEDFIKHLEKSELYEYPEWAVQSGGPTSPLSGESAEATVLLTPGEYVLICGVPMPGGIPHYKKGMTKKLTVTESSDEPTHPEADVQMVLDNYSFNFSSEIQPGVRTMEITNEADQPHEFLLTRLEEGKSGQDMLEWLGVVMTVENGPLPVAPGKFLNGVSPLDKGVKNFVTVDFTPGEYLLICPYPDEGDSKPHFMHGMTKQFTVQ